MTGTSGKTTTAFLLYAVLAAAGRRPGLLGTVETRVDGERRPATRTTAEAIDLQRLFREMLDAGDRSCAMEATSHGSALGRLDGVRFAALVFTNLSQDHLDFHPTWRTTSRRSGGSSSATRAPPAAVNVGDEYGRRLADELRAAGTPLVTFGFADDADIRPEGLDLAGAGDHAHRGRDPAAHAAPRAVQRRERARRRSQPRGCSDPGRRASPPGSSRSAASRAGSRSVDEGQPFTVVVDYAHKPGALENVLRAARELDEPAA